MQQQKVVRWAALVVVIVGLLHGLHHPNAYWWMGVLVGIAVGVLMVAFRASRKINTRIRY